MTGSRSRLLVALVALLIAASLPLVTGWHTEDDPSTPLNESEQETHDVNLSVTNLTIYDEKGFVAEEPWANRADFLANGTHPEYTVVVELYSERGATEDSGPKNVSVYLATPEGISVDDPCWDYASVPPEEDDGTGFWTATITGVSADAQGTPENETLTVHVNDERTEDNCRFREYGETLDSGKTDNTFNRSVFVGSQPDLEPSSAIHWCWYPDARPSGAAHNSTLCPTNQAVNKSDPSIAHSYSGETRGTYFRYLLNNTGPFQEQAPSDYADNDPGRPYEAQDEAVGPFTEDRWVGIANPNPDRAVSLRHSLDVTVTNLDRGRSYSADRARDGSFVDYLGNTSSNRFSLTDKPAGPYRVRMAVDQPLDRIQESDETNNVRTFEFHLFGPDLTPTIDRSTIRTDPSNPYEYGDSKKTIEVDATLANVGNRTAFDDWTWEALLNPGNSDRRQFLTSGEPTSHTFTQNLSAGNSTRVDLNITFCQDSSDSSCYLPAGAHTLHVELDTDDSGDDPWNDTNEESESNNVDEVTFYLNDTTPPSVNSLSPADGAIRRVGENITFRANITEEDAGFQDVTLHLDAPDSDTIRTENMTAATEGGPTWIFNTTLTDLRAQGNYTWWVSGADPSGNAFSTAGNPSTFDLIEYPKNITVESPPPPEGNNVAWNPEDEAFDEINFTATINGTGWTPLNSTTGKHLNLTDPLNRTFRPGLRSLWSDADCPGASSCDEDLFYRVRAFPHPSLLGPDSDVDPSMPGRWNATFAVKDKAGIWKEKSIHFRVQDTPPDVSATKTEVETPLGGGEVDSQSQFTVTTNATDPDGCWYVTGGCHHPGADSFVPTGKEHGMQAVHLNFTHKPSGRDVNITMEMTEGNETESNWTATITTGRNHDLPWAGAYNYSVEGRDIPRNWDVVPAESDALATDTVHVFDTRQPTIDRAGVDPTEEETNVPVRFFAEVSDDTALDVRVSIETPERSSFCGETQTQCSIQLKQVRDTNLYEKKVSFASHGEYEFSVIATDSDQNDATSGTRTLTIAQNRVPVVEVVRPDAPVSGQPGSYYADATPELFLSITDPSGIARDSINLTVDGNAINRSAFDTLSRIESPPARLPGYNLSYTFGSRYNDSAEIPVKVTARDKSTQQKLASVSLDLRVDASAPQANLGSFEPRYRAGGSIWNVSPHTEFTLGGSDPGQTASGVGQILYQIEKETAGSPIPYTGPFKINRTKPGWSGPGLYELTYWAVDRVGNEGLHRTKPVRLDRTGPEITYFPKGRFVNASISDPQGVSEATLHYKPLDEKTFSNTTMSFDEGLYRATLPTEDLTLGDRLEYYISAEDILKNRNLKFSDDGDPYVFEAGNHAPDISWISPEDGTTLQGTQTFRWEASDTDPDQELGFRLEYKLASEEKGAYEELTPVTGPSATYDTSQLPDGVYHLRIVADDGFAESTDVIEVRLDNAEDVAQPNELPANQFRLGEPVTFTTEVNQAAQSVTLVVTRDGQTVAEVPMHDDGAPPDAEAEDNIYSASKQFNKSGTYSWYIAVSYQDQGQLVTDRSDEGQSFQIEATAAQVFERNLGLWVAIVVLGAAALGIGAYGLRNHQQGP